MRSPPFGCSHCPWCRCLISLTCVYFFYALFQPYRLPYSAEGGSWAYGLTYVVCCMSITAAACVLVFILCMFLGALMLIFAGLQDMGDMIRAIDDLFPYGEYFVYFSFCIHYSFPLPRYEDGVMYIASIDLYTQRQIKNQLAECFTFHWKLIR